MDNALVSVICMTYNHEEYIEDAIKGFLMQKTSFPVEIIIHDDASTDNTARIVKKYADMYPEKIIPILQKENQCKLKVNKYETFIKPIARGKYFAICEGDDYWIDENKLQKQVVFMETHPECSMTCHNSYRKNCVTGEMSVENPFRNNPTPTPRQLITQEDGWPATASIMYRAELYWKRPDFFNGNPVGDTPLRLYMMSCGEIHYFSEIMSVYRFNNPVSWTARYLKNKSIQEEYYEKMILFFERYDKYTGNKYTDLISEVIDNYSFQLAIIRKDWETVKQNTVYKNLAFKQKIKYYMILKFPFLVRIKGGIQKCLYLKEKH